MRRIALSLLFGTALVLTGWFGWRWAGLSRPAPVTGLEVTYVCLETREVFTGPVQDIPALNPETGRKTLVPALYSTRTKEWVPAPSEEVLRRNRQSLAGADGASPLAFAPPEDEEPEVSH
jgi:hypothetical protein